MPEDPHALQTQIAMAVADEAIPKIYFNGFVNTATNADMLVLLLRNNKPVALLNASYTVAKSLVQKLGQVVTTLEGATGNPIMTIDYVAEKMEVMNNDSIK